MKKESKSSSIVHKSQITDRRLLLAALHAAKKAGSAILGVYNSDFAVETKADRSPLTRADKESHSIISGCLSQTEGVLPVLSEEGKDISFKIRKNWERFWLVDPLDGTKEFIKRNGEFTVNIALIEGNMPVLGVIHVPVHDVFYFAAPGTGAMKLIKSGLLTGNVSFKEIVDNSIKLPVAADNNGQPEREEITVIASRSHPSPQLERFFEQLKRKYDKIIDMSAGSSMKFCLVAEGAADMYPRYGPTMEWDTAAGQCIVEKAGGSVRRVSDNRPLEYNKPDLLNPWFIVKRRHFDQQ